MTKNFDYLGNTFQIQLLNQIIVDKEFAQSIVDVLESSYFDNKYFKIVIQMIREYYGKYHVTELYKSVMRHFNTNILKWLMRKYKKFKGSKAKAGKLLKEIAKRDPSLFVHWEKGIIDTFA